jgi:hypothetical protein
MTTIAIALLTVVAVIGVCALALWIDERVADAVNLGERPRA